MLVEHLLVEIGYIFSRQQADEEDLLYLGSSAVYRVGNLPEESLKFGWAVWFWVALFYIVAIHKLLFLLMSNDSLVAL